MKKAIHIRPRAKGAENSDVFWLHEIFVWRTVRLCSRARFELLDAIVSFSFRFAKIVFLFGNEYRFKIY